MASKEELLKEFLPLHNHIGIVHDTNLGRLVGIAEDEWDYYYIIRYLPRFGSGNQRGKDGTFTSYHTCVGSFISLKDVYGERYQYMDEIYSMNGAPPTEEFLFEVFESITNV